MPEDKNDLKREKVRIVPISNIEDFPDHPFQVKDDERQKAKFLPHFHRKLSQKLLTDFQNRSIMYDNKPQRRSSHVYEQVLLLLLCHGLPDFCEIREVRSGFRNNKNTVSPHSSCRWA